MNQQKISQQIAQEFNLSKNESERILKYILDTISSELATNNRVYLRGFGSFQRTLHPARKFHNIHTGKLETLPAHHTITFKPAKKFIKKPNTIKKTFLHY